MNWISEVIVDILVTIFIAASVWLGDVWMWWVIVVYTALLLIAKGMALTSEGFLSRTQKTQQAPEWFLHLLYAANILILGFAGWWYLLVGWALIWLFSFLAQRKNFKG